MIRFFIISMIIVVSLQARENPFFPVKGETDIPITSNQSVKIEPLKRATITLPSTARTIESITVKYKNLDGSIENEEILVNSKIDWHEPFVVSHKMYTLKEQEKKSKTQTIKTKYISFTTSNKRMRISTKDKLLQNFLLTNPHRVVMDFKRNTSFRPKSYKLSKAPFSKIRMGNHDGYYRVVIELDGQYRYKLETREKEYTIVVH